MPQIAVINEATEAQFSDAAGQAILAAFSQQRNKDLQSIWGVDTATFTFFPTGKCGRLKVLPFTAMITAG